MRRLEPGASLALPPISSTEVMTDASGWTVNERRGPGGSLAGGARPGRKASNSPSVTKAKSDAGIARSGAATARGVAGERDLPRPEVPGAPTAAPADGADVVTSPLPPGASQKQPNAMKGRAIENWLNQTLGQASKSDGPVVGPSTKTLQGLSQFGIDAAALERLGLDSQSAERVYRAMFVYSQGLHAVLQEAVGKAKSSSAALLVLWRAFMAVMEHAGYSEDQGSDAQSLAALVQRGNEEEKARIESLHKDQLNVLQGQSTKLNNQRRALQEEVGRLREDEMRLRSESEMYKSEHEIALTKYEKEIKLRVDAEVKFLDKTRLSESLQEALDKEQENVRSLGKKLREETVAKETAQVELESLRTQVKILEAQAQAYKQGVAEAAQQKQRYEQQVSQLKQSLERMEKKVSEVKDQLDQEQTLTKKLSELNSGQQRDLRKLEWQCEDEAHIRRELQNERDLLKEKLERADKELVVLQDESRENNKKINELSLQNRTLQIDFNRKAEHLDRTEQQLEKIQLSHRDLVEKHRELSVEAETLRSDVEHLDSQCIKESELRKQLQQKEKHQAGQLQRVQLQLDSTKLTVQTTNKELQDVIDNKVKLESIVRDTKSAMQKMSLEHAMETKAQVQKAAMLEKVIADERAERRNLVTETKEACAKREEALNSLKKANHEIRDLRRQKLEGEEEIDRLRVLLKAQEQRNSDQLVTVDRYHASVANHDAEMRSMQVLLESERDEAKEKLKQMEEAFNKARGDLQLQVELWKMSYEDVLSKLNFMPLMVKHKEMEGNIVELKTELAEAAANMEHELAKVQEAEERLLRRDDDIVVLENQIKDLKLARESLTHRLEEAELERERQAFARNEAEHRSERIREGTKNFEMMKQELEVKVAEAQQTIRNQEVELKKPKADATTQVIVPISDGGCQTDLSYQYLESTGRLNTMGSLPQVELRLEQAAGAAKLFVSQHQAGKMSLKPGGPAAPDSYPMARPPGLPPQGLQRNAQTVRSSSTGARPVEVPPGGGLQVARVNSNRASRMMSPG